MNRKQAILWGALYGGLVGPAIGGAAYPMVVTLVEGGEKSPGLLLLAILGAGLGPMWFGIPGVVVGLVGGPTVRMLVGRIGASVRAYILSALLGALLGCTGVELYNLASSRQLINPSHPFFWSGLIGGAFASAMFVWHLTKSRKATESLEDLRTHVRV